MWRLIMLVAFLGAIVADSEEIEPTISIDPDGEIPEVDELMDDDVPVEGDVLVLTKENFLNVVKPKELILVEFYAPWCGHCKSLAPEYAKAARELKPLGIHLAKVDATQQQALAKEHLVSGYPTIKLFKKGVPIEDYRGARTAEALVAYMKKHADPKYTPPPSSVMVLNSSNFSNTIKSNKLMLVEFYAPWCRHCRALEPEFEGAATTLKEDKIPLAKVNAMEEKDLAEQNNVNSYPTLLVFRNGRRYKYRGKRELGGIVAYMKEQAQSPSREVSTPQDALNHLSRTEVTVVGFFTKKNKNMLEEYLGVANELRGKLTFLHTFDQHVGTRLNLKLDSLSILLPKVFQSQYEKPSYHYTKTSGTSNEMVKWITEMCVPLVGRRSKANMDFKYTNRPLLVVYYDVSFSHDRIKETQYVRKRILPVADKYRDIVFAISDEEEFEDEIKNLGLEESADPVNVAIYSDHFRYPMTPGKEFDTEVLQTFVDQFKAGKLTPYLKSQPVPKHQEGHVKIIVARSFERKVMETRKDVLIEFYAPWCSHCKTLEPTYKKLAKHFAKTNPDLLVAKMDATANDVHPMFKIDGFPTIYLVRASNKRNPLRFSGIRSFEALKDFVKENVSADTSEDESSKDEL